MNHPLCVWTSALLASAALAQAQTVAPPAPPAPEETITLNPFVVSTDQDRGYIATNSITATRINTPIRDVPVAIGVISDALIADTNAQTLAEALRFSAAFDLEGTQGRGSIRGMAALFDGNANRNGTGVSSRGDVGQGSGIGNSLDSLTATDRIEIFKGPASIINGLSLPGGTVNTVTKRARQRTGGRAEATIGSQEVYRGQVEWNQVLQPDRISLLAAASYRVQNSDTWDRIGVQDTARNLYLTGYYRYQPASEIGFDIQHDKSDVTANQGRVDAFTTVNVNSGEVPLAALGVPLDYQSNADSVRRSERVLPTLTWTHAWQQWLSTYFRYNSQDATWDSTGWLGGSVLNNRAANPIDPLLGRRPFEVRHRFRNIIYEDTYDQFEARALFDVTTGPLRNRLQTSLVWNEYNFFWHQIEDRVVTAPRDDMLYWRPLEALRSTPSAFYNQDYSFPTNPNMVTNFLENSQSKDWQFTARYLGEMETRIGTFHALAGLNKGETETLGGSPRITYDGGVRPGVIPERPLEKRRSDWLPSIGIVYQPNETLSFYVAANQSYTFQFRRNSFRELLPNETGESMEVGTKLDLFDGRVVGTVALFQTIWANRPYTVSGYPVRDAELADGTIIRTPADQARWNRDTNPVVSGVGTETLSAGEFESEGIDLDLVLTPIRNWQTTLSYVYADAKISADGNPLNIGRREEGNAKITAAGFTSYTFASGLLQRLTVGGGYRWSSDRVHRYNEFVVDGTRRLVQFDRDGSNSLDLFARYSVKLGGNPVSFQVNAQNLLREDLMVGRKPLTGTATAPWEFYRYQRPIVWRFTTTVEF